jgi:hypothetical protein
MPADQNPATLPPLMAERDSKIAIVNAAHREIRSFASHPEMHGWTCVERIEARKAQRYESPIFAGLSHSRM